MRVLFTNSKCSEWYFWTVCILLIFTASLKLMAVTEASEAMHLSDPLFRVNNRGVLVSVAVFEVAIAVHTVFGREVGKRALLLLWLNAHFLLYRWGISLVAPGAPCRCLGTLSNLLFWKQRTLDLLIASLIVYFVVGSVLILLSALLNAQQHAPMGNRSAPSIS
jgi:hypothetical protein